MITNKCKSFRACVLITALSLLLSGTASAFSAGNARSNSFSFDRNISTVITYRGLDYTFDQKISMLQNDQVESPVMPDSGDQDVPSLISYGKDFFPDIRKGSKKIFDRENLTFALIGLGMIGLARTADDKVKNYAQDRRPLDDESKIGNMLGKTTLHAGIGATLFGAGKLANSPKLADTGIVVLESLLVNSIATEALKYSFRRSTPDGHDRTSFPSGYVSSTAALAASISGMYDWTPKVAVPLYAAAVFVGASRIQDNKNYLSDVIAGMTLGTIVGFSFAEYHKEKKDKQKNGKKISFEPIIEKNIKGAVFTMKW